MWKTLFLLTKVMMHLKDTLLFLIAFFPTYFLFVLRLMTGCRTDKGIVECMHYWYTVYWHANHHIYNGA